MKPSPASILNGRRILLGVSGGIAAYKTPELVRLFKKAGAKVKVVMTPDATRFVTPLTLGTVSENEVLIDIIRILDQTCCAGTLGRPLYRCACYGANHDQIGDRRL